MKEQDNLYKFVDSIKDRRDFEHFLMLLKDDFIKNRGKWENDNLENYLEALHASNATNEKRMREAPSWKLFADLLLTAIVYE